MVQVESTPARDEHNVMYDMITPWRKSLEMCQNRVRRPGNLVVVMIHDDLPARDIQVVDSEDSSELELFLLLPTALFVLRLRPLLHLITDDIVKAAPICIGTWNVYSTGR